VFIVPIEYAESCVAGVAQKTAVAPRIQDAAPASVSRSQLAAGWHEAAYRLSRLSDIVREVSLCVPEERYPQREYIAPSTPAEAIVAGIWAEVLHRERVGVRDDFFGLGGDSLLAVQALARIASALGVELSLRELLEGATVEEVAQKVAAFEQPALVHPHVASPPALELRTSCKVVPLTFQQEWIWNELQQNAWPLCSMGFRLSGELDVDVLSKSLETLVQRHDSLRTRISVADGMPKQYIDASAGCELQVVDLTGVSTKGTYDGARAFIERLMVQKSNMVGGPLYEVRLLRVSDTEHVLVIAIHHIVTDAVSQELIRKELFTLYGDFVRGREPSLPRVVMQYSDYAVWQRSTRSQWVQKHERYWNRRLSGATRVRLPIDPVMESVTRFSAGQLQISFDEAVSLALNDLARRERTLLAMVMLAVYAAVVSFWSGQRDFLMPLGVASRLREHVNLVGLVAHPLLLRIELTGNETFVDLVQIVSREYLAASEHVDFGRAAYEIPDLFKGTFFQWLSAHPNDIAEAAPLSELDCCKPYVSIEPLSFKRALPDDLRWTEDVSLNLWNTAQGIHGHAYYRADLFTPNTMQQFSQDLRLISEQAARNPQARMTSLSEYAHHKR
jgi:acyl carrier protein